MDSLKKKNPIRKRPSTEFARNLHERTSSVHKHAEKQNAHPLKIKADVLLKEKSPANIRLHRLISIIVSPILVAILIGTVYARGSLTVVPVSEIKEVPIDITISTTPGINLIHGVWIQGNTQAVMSVFTPKYIPVAYSPSAPYSIVALRSDIERYVTKKIEITNSQYIHSIQLHSVDIDSYALFSIPERLTISAIARVEITRTIDIEELAKRCELKFIIARSKSFENCIKKNGDIARAQLTVHPWFSLRTPIARAFEITTQQ